MKNFLDNQSPEAEAERLRQVRLDRIKANPGRAGTDDVTFLVEQIEELQRQLRLNLQRQIQKLNSRGGQ